MNSFDKNIGDYFSSINKKNYIEKRILSKVNDSSTVTDEKIGFNKMNFLHKTCTL